MTVLEIINGSIAKLTFEDNLFGLTCEFDIVEHVLKDEIAVFGMKRVTKDRILYEFS